MTKRLNAKYKIDRRLGANIWGRPTSPFNKRAYKPGQHGQNTQGKPTEFAMQLQAKQRLKGYYGNISERQFERYYKESTRRAGDTSENLIGLLESRLDAIVYRLGFASTVFASRQIINHGHILVNGRKINIASYKVKAGDEISVNPKSLHIDTITTAHKVNEREVPDYLTVDYTKFKGVFVRVPKLESVPYPITVEPHLIVEFYSR